MYYIKQSYFIVKTVGSVLRVDFFLVVFTDTKQTFGSQYFYKFVMLHSFALVKNILF